VSRLGSLASSEEVYTKAEADSAISVSVQGVQIGGGEPAILAGLTSQYWRGDKTWQTLDKSAVGLGNVDNTSDLNKPISTATQTALNAKAPLVSPSFTTPALGAATGTSLAVTGALTSSGTAAGIGYAAGAGGTVTQATNKATAVTLNKITGEITLNAAALAAGTIVTFVLNNSTIAANDVIVINHVSAGTFGAYTVNARATGAGTASIAIRNNSAGSLSEAIVIRFAVIKAVNA
jgi:hypothetical protein